MKTLARKRNGSRPATDGVEELQAALDRSYAQWREQARREWHRRRTGADPSDACVHVHIEQHAS